MGQGLRNAVATMQRFMDGVLYGLQPLFTLVYIDDLSIFSRSIEENVHHLEQVSHRLQDANIQVNLQKCRFAFSENLCLGFLISFNKIQLDLSLIAKTANFADPQDVRDVMSFIRLASYYRKWIRNFSEIAILTNLSKSHHKISNRKLPSPQCASKPSKY